MSSLRVPELCLGMSAYMYMEHKYTVYTLQYVNSVYTVYLRRGGTLVEIHCIIHRETVFRVDKNMFPPFLMLELDSYYGRLQGLICVK